MTDYYKKYSDTAAAVERIKQLEQHETDLAGLIRDLRKENDALKTVSEQLENRVKCVEPLVEELRLDISRMQGRIGGLTTQIRKLKSDEQRRGI